MKKKPGTRDELMQQALVEYWRAYWNGDVKPGRPELTLGQREASDRPIIDPIWKMLDERLRAGDTYRKARAAAIQHAVNVTRLDESVVRKAWRRCEPVFRAIDKMNRENDFVINALNTLRTRSPGKKIVE